MARTKTIIDYKKLHHLKKMTEKKFGRTIVTSKDCNDLTKALLENTTYTNLHAQTIRRLYDLVKSDFSPSIYTLDLLGQYVSNTSWADYNFNEEIETQNIKSEADWVLDYYRDEQFGINKVVDKIAANEDLQNLVIVKLASFKAAQWMLFENRPFRDSLNKSYKKAIEVYIEAKGTTEAEIFGFGMLFNSAFLTENTFEIERYFKIIDAISLTKDVYNIPAARKFGVPLLYYHLNNDEVNFLKTFNEALIARNLYQDKMSLTDSNFDSILVEHLILIGRYRECKIVWELHLKFSVNHSDSTNSACYQQFIILIEAFVFGHQKFNKNILCFDSEKMRIGERKYYNLMFLVYLIKFTKKSSRLKLLKLNKQLDDLIFDTGYTYFRQLIN